MALRSFRDLTVWQRARDCAVEVYRITDEFPHSELYGLSNQMRRAAISISSNIAEGFHRFQAKEKKQFFRIAYGSGAELESQLEITNALFPKIDYVKTETLLQEVMRMLNKLTAGP